MEIYSTRKFIALISASIIGGVLILSALSAILPGYIPIRPTPDFQLSSTTTSVAVPPGSPGTFNIQLKSVNGFSGSVSLTATATNAPRSLNVQVSPTNLVLPLGGSADVALTVTSVPTTPVADYSITIKEVSGTLSHTDTLTLNMVGFTVTANPSSLTTSTSSPVTSNITLASLNGFSGSVGLVTSTSAAGPVATMTPNSFYLTQGGTAASTLTVKSAAQGRFDVVVTGISNQISQSVSVPVTVSSGQTTGDFKVTTFPKSVSMSPNTSRDVIIQLASVNGCVCLVTLSTSGIAGFGLGVSPFIVSLGANAKANSTLSLFADASAQPGQYLLYVTGTSNSLVHAAALAVAVSSQAVSDFSLVANPAVFNIVQGSSTSTTITVYSLAGFAGDVTLTGGIIPAVANDPSVSFSPTKVTVPANGIATAQLTISTTNRTLLQGYNYTVTGTSGTLFHTIYGGFAVVSPAVIALTRAVSVGQPFSAKTGVSTSPLVTDIIVCALIAVLGGLTIRGDARLHAGILELAHSRVRILRVSSSQARNTKCHCRARFFGPAGTRMS